MPAKAAAESPAPLTGSFRVLTRVAYTIDGDEYFAGPGEVIDGAAAAQVDPTAVELIPEV